MVVGPRKTLFMDEISTGLDSSTTFQIVKCLRNFVHEMEATILMALLQPAPETFDLFDDLILLSEGYMVYQGPRAEVVQFFESLGFRLPPRKGVADFLQEVICFMLCVIDLDLLDHQLTCMIFRSLQKRTKNNIGQILRNHMNLCLFRRLQKHLRTPKMEGL